MHRDLFYLMKLMNNEQIDDLVSQFWFFDRLSFTNGNTYEYFLLLQDGFRISYYPATQYQNCYLLMRLAPQPTHDSHSWKLKPGDVCYFPQQQELTRTASDFFLTTSPVRFCLYF